MCLVFSIIEYVYRRLGSFLSSMFVIGSSYVSYLRSHVICIALSYLLMREMSDLLLRTPSHCHFHHYIHYWCDFTSCLTWVDHHVSSHIHCFTVVFIVACDSSRSLHVLFSSYSNPSRVRYSLCIIITHITISSFCFICLLTDIIFTLGILRSMAHGVSLYMLHFIYEGMSFDHWVFGPSFLSFLLPYHLSLRYVPCLKTTLRPWDQMSSLTAFTWTGVWDLVDI